MTTPVNFEVAKLLKDKGFKQKTISLDYYLPSGNMLDVWYVANNKNYRDYSFYAPTIAEVIMWLYEKHGFWMYVEKGINPDNFYPVIQNHVSFKYSPNHWKDTISEAYEAGILHILNNLI